MNKNLFRLAALLIVLSFSTGAGAQVVNRPVAPQTAAVWAGLVAANFGSPNADPAAISGILMSVAHANTIDPAVKASLQPVTEAIQAHADTVIKAAKAELLLARAEKREPRGHALEKTSLFATALQTYLTKEQLSEAGTMWYEHHRALSERAAFALADRRRELAGNWMALPEETPYAAPRGAFGLPRLLARNPDKARPREALFVKLYGPALRRHDGIVSVKAVTSPTHYGVEHAVRVEVVPTADMAQIKAALEPHLYAGVDIKVESRGWELYEITSRGRSVETHKAPLDDRMSLSVKNQGWAGATWAFVERYGAALEKSLPGTAKVRPSVPRAAFDSWGAEERMAMSGSYSVVVDIEPTVDMARVKEALEPYRYAGTKIEVMSHGWSVYEIDENGGSRDLAALDPRMAESSKLNEPPAPSAGGEAKRPKTAALFGLLLAGSAAVLMASAPSAGLAALAGLVLPGIVVWCLNRLLRGAGVDDLGERALVDLGAAAALVAIVACGMFAYGAGLSTWFWIPAAFSAFATGMTALRVTQE